MRQFVISLCYSVERRRRMRAQLEAAGVEFGFFDAIDLQRDRNRYFHHCDDAQFLLDTGRVPTAGELGCFASHRMLWRTCRLLGEPLVILEDDAELTPQFATALDFVARHIDRLGFVRLQENDRPLQVPVVRGGRHAIRYSARYPHGSAGYAISPRTADAFIERSRVFAAPVDVFIKRYWSHGQPLYSLYPAVVRSGPLSHATTLDGRRRTALPPRQALERWCRKRQDGLRRELFNLRWLRAHDGEPMSRVVRGLAANAFRSGN